MCLTCVVKAWSMCGSNGLKEFFGIGPTPGNIMHSQILSHILNSSLEIIITMQTYFKYWVKPF